MLKGYRRDTNKVCYNHQVLSILCENKSEGDVEDGSKASSLDGWVGSETKTEIGNIGGRTALRRR